jgi:anti-sigma-K factor RskA
MAIMTMDEDREILAAEYALGTLDASERAQAERLIASDPDFAARVRYWEGRLSLLARAVGDVEPPSELWTKIAADLPAAARSAIASGGADVIDLTRRLKRWRTATYVAGALAASLLLFVGIREAYQPKPESGRFVPRNSRSAASAPKHRATVRSSFGWCTTSSRHRVRSA